MAEQKQETVQKKRQAKPGTRRLVVNLSEQEYGEVVKYAGEQMREPNNMLSFALRGRVTSILIQSKE